MSSGVGFFSDWLPGHALKNDIGVSLRLDSRSPRSSRHGLERKGSPADWVARPSPHNRDRRRP